MDTRIALAGTPIDPVGAMSNGFAAGLQNAQGQRQNALAQLYQTQGPGIMAGDPGALNSLAQFDPSAAMGVQSAQLGMQAQRQDMAFSAERMQMAREEAKKAAADAAARMTAEQRAAEAEQLNTVLRGAAAMYAQGNQAGYNQFLQSRGVDPAQYPFDQFPTFAAMGDGVLEALKTTKDIMAPPPPVDLTDGAPSGYRWNDPNDQTKGVSLLDGYTKPGPQTVINNGGEGAFDKNLGEADAATISGASAAGLSAQRSLIQVGQLEQLLKTTPTGVQGLFVQAAGRFGLPVTGADDVQAAQAIISALVPAQRPAGSGTMSDADLELFKNSLPSILNQPGGNAKIIETIKAIAKYDMDGANIALRVRLPEGDPMKLSRADALAALQARENPLAGLGAPTAIKPGQYDGTQTSPIQIGPAGEGFNKVKPGQFYQAPDGNVYQKM